MERFFEKISRRMREKHGKFGFVGAITFLRRGGACPSRNLRKLKIAKDFYVAGGASPSPTTKHESHR
jgi:hypothetical protein